MAWPSTTIVTTDMDAGTDSPATARAEIKKMADDINAMIAALNAALGVAGLDAGGLIASAQLPVVPATKGGTGQSSYTIGDIFYANTTTTLAKLSAGTSGFSLVSNGAGAAPSWQNASGFASGTRMPFNQTLAPTGWTKQTTGISNDSIMRIVTGTVASGGSLAFSTWAAQTSVGATTLSSAQSGAPAHTHGPGGTATSFAGYSASGLSHATGSSSGSDPTFTATAANTAVGAASSHTHSLSQSILYHDFIIAQKD